MTDAALFDWDGTLLDSREALLTAWHTSTTEVLGRPFPTTETEHELVFTLGGRVLFPRIAADDGQAAALAARFQEVYERSGEHVRAFDGVHDALARVREAGVPVGVVTSKARARYARDAERAGLGRLVDVAVCAEDVTAPKPDPEPVVRALEALGAAAERSVLAGDTPVDIQAGAAAGTDVLGVAWGYGAEQPLLDAGARTVARDPAELVGLLLLHCDREETPT